MRKKFKYVLALIFYIQTFYNRRTRNLFEPDDKTNNKATLKIIIIVLLLTCDSWGSTG